MIIHLKDKHSLKIDQFYFKCCIGKNGLTKKKLKEIKKLLEVFTKLEIYISEKIELKNLKLN